MAEQNLNFWDYVKAAFHWRIALPLLGRMPLNKLAIAGFGILGFGSPGFWLLGLAYESSYLLWMAGNPRFQKLVQGMALAAKSEEWGAREARMLDELDGPSCDAYQRLVGRCRSIVQAEASSSEGLAALKSEGLNQLLLIFLQLLVVRQRIRDTLAKTRKEDIENDIKDLEKQVASEPENSSVCRALQGTLDIQRKRLDNLVRSIDSLKFTETELGRIEKQVSLVSEEMALNRNPEQWSITLDTVVDSMQGTSKWMNDHSQLFGTIDMPATQVDVIGGNRAAGQKAGQ